MKTMAGATHEALLVSIILTKLEGDAEDVEKFEDDQLISRTSVLTMSNGNPFKNPHLACRMYTYKWRSCPGLISVTKKPHPASFFSLLQKYKIDY